MKIFLLCIILALPSIKVHAEEVPIPVGPTEEVGVVVGGEQQEQLEALARPLIAWLNDNCTQHSTITVDLTGAPAVEGFCVFRAEATPKE